MTTPDSAGLFHDRLVIPAGLARPGRSVRLQLTRPEAVAVHEVPCAGSLPSVTTAAVEALVCGEQLWFPAGTLLADIATAINEAFVRHPPESGPALERWPDAPTPAPMFEIKPLPRINIDEQAWAKFMALKPERRSTGKRAQRNQGKPWMKGRGKR